MSYLKLYKVTQDGAVGYQTVNQLADNAADLRTQLAVEHGTVDPSIFHPKVAGGFGNRPPLIDYHGLGKHDLQEIPRGVAQTLVFSQFAGFGTFSTGLAWTGPGISSVQWISTGVYFLPIIGLSSFWAKVTPLVAVGVTALEPQVRQLYSSTIYGPVNGLQVSLFKLDAGDFIPDDQAFTIALYGTP